MPRPQPPARVTRDTPDTYSLQYQIAELRTLILANLAQLETIADEIELLIDGGIEGGTF